MSPIDVPDDTETQSSDRITVGDRVIYRGSGVFNGRRGRVEDIFGGQAKVAFRGSTLMEPLEVFEPVEIVHETTDKETAGDGS